MKLQRLMGVAILVAVGMAACAADDDRDDRAAPAPDAAATAPSAPVPPPPPPPTPSTPDAAPVGPELVVVEEDRELRALWLATVSRLDYPSVDDTPESGTARLAAIVDLAAKAHLNAIFFQVRPESDAFYESALEPWSRYLTGTQGEDPGYDPLATLLRLAHARGIEVHAWVNPYRAIARASDPVTAGHVANVLDEAAIPYDGTMMMNPASPALRDWVLAVVDDLLDHYAVDGLHYDDYFYPYPDRDNTPFPDAADYAAYVAGGGTLSREEWRVDNVNALVRDTGALVTAEHPTVRFGISPFGVFRPDPSRGIAGLDAYATLGCDAPRWLAEGWVDYVAPQLYWPTTQTGRAFGTLASFWSQSNGAETQIFLGHALYQLDSSVAWSFDELESQVAIGRGLRAGGQRVGGSVFFRVRNLEPAGLADKFASRLFPGLTLPPTLPRAARVAGVVAPPRIVSASAARVELAADATPAEFHALYTQAEESSRWTLIAVVAGTQTELTLPGPGRYAVSNLMPGAVESLAVRVSY